MKLTATKQNLSVQFLIVFSLAILLSYYLSRDFNPLVFVAFVGVALLVYFFLSVNFKVFILILIAIKPFIDLTVNIKWLQIGGAEFNSLQIVGGFVFIVLAYNYFAYYSKKKIFNGGLIWGFLIVHAFSGIVAIYGGRKILSVVAYLLTILDAYFIYFIFSSLIKDKKYRLKIYEIIWISTFLNSIVFYIAYVFGISTVDVSKGIERFGGFYNDPGSPSYLAVISLVFGTLYIEILRKEKKNISLFRRVIYISTICNLPITLWITLTKSAVVMVFVFLTMWWGLYKKKFFLIFPLIIIVGYFAYTGSDLLQNRISPEVEFLTSGDFSYEAALSIGSGRIARWERLLKGYAARYNLFQKFFGRAINYAAHNQYIAYLMQTGIVGLTIFVLILYGFYKRLIVLFKQQQKPEIFMTLTLLSIFSIYALTGHPFDYTTILWYLMILLSLINFYSLKPFADNVA